MRIGNQKAGKEPYYINTYIINWLLAVGCWLLAVGCWLLAVGCWLLAVLLYMRILLCQVPSNEDLYICNLFFYLCQPFGLHNYSRKFRAFRLTFRLLATV
jgi:hypothetical protein